VDGLAARLVAVLAQADPVTKLYEYGVIGILVVILSGVVRALFQRMIKAHEVERERSDRELQREIDRADKAEAEVRRLNAVIQDKTLPILAEATRTLADATRMISDALNVSRRGGGQ
jgi:hypothetical protein